MGINCLARKGYATVAKRGFAGPERYSGGRDLVAFRLTSRARLGTSLAWGMLFLVLPARRFTSLTDLGGKTCHIRKRGSTLRRQRS